MDNSNKQTIIKVRHYNFPPPDQEDGIQIDNNEITIEDNNTQQTFAFNTVLDQNVSLEETYTTLAEPLIQKIFNGQPSTVMTYGPSATGKSYTLKGEVNNMGIIQRTIHRIYQQLAENPILFEVSVSSFEIYNEKILDLTKDVQQKYYITVKDGETSIPGLPITATPTEQNCRDLFQQSLTNRYVHIGQMNSNCGIAMYCFRINVKNLQQELPNGYIQFIDLPAAQNVSKCNPSPTALKEIQCINSVMSTLKQIVEGILEHKQHLPFRNSKVTQYLENIFVPQHNLRLIFCISLNKMYNKETLQCLKFAQKAQQLH